MITVQHNLTQLNESLQRYAQYSKLSWPQILAKQGSKLTYAISARLRAMMPPKGKVTSELLASLGAGRGVKVRKSIRARIFAKVGANVRIADREKAKVWQSKGLAIKGIKTRAGRGTVSTKGKLLNLQALAVKAELAARESGRGYLGYATRIRTNSVEAVKEVKKLGRLHQQLGAAGLIISNDEAGIRFVWGGMSRDGEALGVGAGLNKDQQQRAIAQGIGDVNSDVMEYVRRKQEEALQRSFEAGKAAAS